jgi:hypothetical protein
VKWFTRAWQRGDEPDVNPGDAYAAYIRAISAQLPPHVGEFALPSRRHFAVDDARVDRAELDRDGRTLRLRLLNGDLPTGYGKLTLDFVAAEIAEPVPAEAGRLLADRSTEFLVHEVELVAPRQYEVRFLLHPRGELHVRCEDVRPTWEPIDDRTRTDYRSEVRGFADVRLT